MKNIFKSKWIEKKGFSSMAEEESEGAEHYRHLASEFTEMAEDESDHKHKLEEMEAKKATTNITHEISKPGPSIHSAKWDRCVEHVKDKNPDANAYDVCTAQLGEESFKSIAEMTKSELSLTKEELTKAIDIVSAGKIPESLLARQDLKDDHETTIKGEDKPYTIMIEYKKQEDTEWLSCEFEVKARSDDEAKNMACGLFQAKFNKIKNTEGNVVPIPYDQQYQIRQEGVNIKKGVVEQTGKKLEVEAEKAEEAEETTEKEDIVRNIKNIQIKRQKDIIEERSNKSFNNKWKEKYGR